MSAHTGLCVLSEGSNNLSQAGEEDKQPASRSHTNSAKKYSKWDKMLTFSQDDEAARWRLSPVGGPILDANNKAG